MVNQERSMNELAKLIATSEDRLMKILLSYALKRGYTKYSSTLEEAWRMSISTLSRTMTDACRDWDGPPELGPDEDYLCDPIARFGIAEAQKHRARGISIDMFLGLMKYYRQSYLDVVKEAGFEREHEETCRLFVDRFYDRIELGFCKEWVNTEQTHLIEDLQAKNRVITTEKNKFLTAYESLPNSVILINTELKIENMNRAAMRFLQGNNVPGAHYYRSLATEDNYPAKSFCGQELEDLFPWLMADIRQFTACDDRSLTAERYVQTGTTSICFEVEICRMLDISQKFTGMIIVLADITERKRAEEALCSEKELLSVTLASIGDGVITTDVTGRITSMNKVAEELTGWSYDQASGKNVSDVFHIINEQTRESCETPVTKVLKSGGIVGLANHAALIRRDGRELIIDDSGAPIRNSEGKIIGVVLVFHDITEKEGTQRSLQNTQKLEAVGELAGGIAHDFNNLLGGLFGYLDLARIQAETEGSRSVANTLSKAIDVFDRAKYLTQQLLTFSKGGAPIRKTQSIAECVRKSISFALSGSNISPVFTIPNDTWLCDFDESQIEQALDNITINARQAMPMGGKIKVAIRNIPLGESPEALPPSAYVCISICDQGPGIQKEHLTRIFEPFFTTKHQGSGLGLATCYSIVKKHNGRIDVESEFGKGTSLHIYLPASSTTISIEKTSKQDPHQGSSKILVMDDEPYIREILAIMLERMGYGVATAKNGDEATEIAKSAIQSGQPFGAAILDLTIPGGRGGKEMVHDLLEMDPGIKVIASSGYSEDPVMSNPSRYGFATRLIKPYRMGDLIKALESIFSGSC